MSDPSAPGEDGGEAGEGDEAAPDRGDDAPHADEGSHHGHAERDSGVTSSADASGENNAEAAGEGDGWSSGEEEDLQDEEEMQQEQDHEGGGDESPSGFLDPNRIKVEPDDVHDAGQSGDDDDVDSGGTPARHRVNVQIKMEEFEEEEEDDEDDVDPEDDEAVWNQDEDPDFSVAKVRRWRAAKRNKNYRDDDGGGDDDDDDEDDDDQGESSSPPARGQRRQKRRIGANVEAEAECEKCQRMCPTLSALVRHVVRTRPCRQHYGEDRVDELKAAREAADPASSSKSQKSRKGGHVRKTRKGARVYGARREMFSEPEEPQGVVRWRQEEAGEKRIGTCQLTTTRSDQEVSSKLDLENLEEAVIQCMPRGYSLISRIVRPEELDQVHGFVGVAVSDGGEAVEVRPLLARANVNLADMRELFHAVMAVTGISMKDILSDKSCPISLISYKKNLLMLRNRYCKEIMANNNQKPDPPKPICIPGSSRETLFLSLAMKDEIPAEQLLVNFGLSSNDMGAVALECRFEEEKKGVKLIPLVTISMIDWHASIQYLFTILINWVGSKDLLEKMWLATPCGVQGERMVHHELRKECHRNILMQKKISVCEHCGKIFEFNPFIPSEKAKYDKHLAIHKTTCRICGEVFPNLPAKRNHQKTHRDTYFPCTAKKGCKFVGSTQEFLDKHIQFRHTRIVCELCGKEYTNKNTLQSHLQFTHNKVVCPDLVCSFCGKTGFIHEYFLRRHEKRHRVATTVNGKTVPRNVGFVCPLSHDNCKRYFRKASFVRRHIRIHAHEDAIWKGRELPENMRTKIPRRKGVAFNAKQVFRDFAQAQALREDTQFSQGEESKRPHVGRGMDSDNSQGSYNNKQEASSYAAYAP